jgi:hypothetical protein
MIGKGVNYLVHFEVRRGCLDGNEMFYAERSECHIAPT